MLGPVVTAINFSRPATAEANVCDVEWTKASTVLVNYASVFLNEIRVSPMTSGAFSTR